MSTRKPFRPRYAQIVLYIVLLVITVGLICLLRSCPVQNAVEDSADKGDAASDTLDVALVYGPASYYIYGDTLGGYNYDLLRHISRLEDVPMRFWPVGGLKEGLRQLDEGKFDMLASLPADAGYEQRYIYSDPVYLDRHVLVQRKNREGKIVVMSALDLAGDTVHIATGSPAASRLADLSREIGDTIYIVEHDGMSAGQLMLMVRSGEIRYAVVSGQIALQLTHTFKDLDISSPISFTQFQSIALASSDTVLQRRLNVWLRRVLNTPEVRRLKDRYNL